MYITEQYLNGSHLYLFNSDSIQAAIVAYSLVEARKAVQIFLTNM